MSPQPPLANSLVVHALSNNLIYAALALYGLAALLVLWRPRAGRPLVAAAALAHMSATVLRGVAIGFFPLTNKMESFSMAALALALVLVWRWWPRRLYLLPLLVLIGLALGVAVLAFGLELHDAPPLMHTLWYPLHVPLSFFAYALWWATAALALCWWRDRDPSWLPPINELALLGLALWSLSMIAGGIWGVLAWGAYFLWDPKVLWSVILWFHYASFIHVRLTPSLRSHDALRPALALLGALWVFVAYIGTSFFFGGSSHGW